MIGEVLYWTLVLIGAVVSTAIVLMGVNKS